jgi:RNA polymerase sigma factor (sigma-70 family)
MAARVMALPLNDATVQSIVHRAARGCPDAFSELYASHHRYVLWICRRYFLRPEDAEDAAAEVFVKLHSVLGSHDASLPFRPWLAQVTARHCLDRLRRGERERRRHVADDAISALPDLTSVSPLARVLREEELQKVREELARLPERLRLPLVLHYHQEMSYEEIARVLGRRMPIVKAMLFRARRALRRKLLRNNAARDARLATRRTPAPAFSLTVSPSCAAD